MSEQIVNQAWYLFRRWANSPNPDQDEEVARAENGLFDLLKQSDPNWRENIKPYEQSPPALSVHITDGMGSKDKVGG